MHHDELRNVITEALALGGRHHSVMCKEWDISMGCQDPVTRVLFQRPGADVKDDASKFVLEVQKHFPGAAAKHLLPARKTPGDKIVVAPGKSVPLELTLLTPCRKCGRCLRRRANLWASRAMTELRAAPRTWFVTLTLGPSARTTMISRARVTTARNTTVDQTTGEFISDDYDALSYGDQFQAIHREISSEITRYVKRIRKNSGANLRYVFVTERHKDGFPHYHALVHECDGVLTKATLRDAWHLGFGLWKLADPAHAKYVTKYLSKSAVARVRASQDYGHPPAATGGLRADPRAPTTTPGRTTVQHMGA